MKRIVLVIIALISLSSYAQMRRNNRNSIPQTNTEPSEQEIAKHKRMMEERKDEFIANFLTTLEADEFQKEIIKQTLNSFFDEKVALFKVPYERSFDREQAVEKLENTHFSELEELISKNDMTKIREMIKGDFDEKEVIKKKKKKKRNKKTDNDDG